MQNWSPNLESVGESFYFYFQQGGINPQKKSHADSYLAGISAPSLRDKGIIEDTKARYMYAYFFRKQREKFKLPWRNNFSWIEVRIICR